MCTCEKQEAARLCLPCPALPAEAGGCGGRRCADTPPKPLLSRHLGRRAPRHPQLREAGETNPAQSQNTPLTFKKTSPPPGRGIWRPCSWKSCHSQVCTGGDGIVLTVSCPGHRKRTWGECEWMGLPGHRALLCCPLASVVLTNKMQPQLRKVTAKQIHREAAPRHDRSPPEGGITGALQWPCVLALVWQPSLTLGRANVGRLLLRDPFWRPAPASKWTFWSLTTLLHLLSG